MRLEPQGCSFIHLISIYQFSILNLYVDVHFLPLTYTFHCHHLPNLRGSFSLPPFAVFTFRGSVYQRFLALKATQKESESTWGGVGLGVRVGEGDEGFCAGRWARGPLREEMHVKALLFLATTIKSTAGKLRSQGNLTKFFKPPTLVPL